MTLKQAWSYARADAKRYEEIAGNEVVYSQGSFYWKGDWYYTKTGSLINGVDDATD